MARLTPTRQMITTKREAAFWALVSRPDDDSCWHWMGHKTAGGYGQFSIGGRAHGMEGAHRICWLLCRGEIPAGSLVLHNCPGGDTPSCVNPRHLFLGTQKENAQDASLKKRLPVGNQHWSHRRPDRVARGDSHGKRTKPESIQRGEAAGASILTEESVVEIRIRAAASESLAALGRAFGVSRGAIWRIVHRKTWRHVP